MRQEGLGDVNTRHLGLLKGLVHVRPMLLEELFERLTLLRSLRGVKEHAVLW